MPESKGIVMDPRSFFFFLVISVIGFVNGEKIHHQSNHQKSLLSTPMILPLYRKTPNSSKFVQENFHRQLKEAEHRHPNARMRLHDDLLTNGYYTTHLLIGTPPQEFALIVDSGSTVTYVPCSTCEQCGKHQDPKFQPDLSSTYAALKCNIDCTCDSDNNQCIYERQYAEMSSSSGVLGVDIISFGNGSALEPQRATFGCENMETGDLYSQRADGIMGLGRGPLSIMDQLTDKGIISDSFSLCYGGMKIGGGAMVLGAINPLPEMVFSHSDANRSPYYNIELKELHVGGDRLKVNPSVFDEKHGTVLDSGTTYAYLPEPVFVPFKDAIMKKLSHLKQIHGPDPNYNDICFAGAGSDITQLSKNFPEVDMVFENGKKLPLSPENYLFRHSKVRGAYCLGIFQNGRDPTTLLGGIVVRNTLVTYDRQNERIGFLKTNCSELWETLNVPGAPSPAPTPSSSNSTIGLTPMLAPSGLPNYIDPEDFQVGLITFDMSLSVNYTDLEPHIDELTGFIAHELEVNASQVHLLNFRLKGNESLVRWVICPAESDYYISNTTAKSIFSRLNEHRLQLPENFGSYKLLEWKVEPPPKRSWWARHFIAVIGGVVITLILGFTSIGIWFVWRRKQALNNYKPVNVGDVVQESELQPL
ncbi:hypothetical protein C5167_010681 [Papaver somniferum]|uniref:Peptidase A1 domain-containing protein n=1 Tax=Papaver somniferum TaxID=3469 RepID=A0A4Y7K412_PAPSO|nr:aspartic proteinase CDR1-like [Papaver somniferum]RZC66991.1 hypothetical protein C5167_010681 [Papaver somniferum]